MPLAGEVREPWGGRPDAVRDQQDFCRRTYGWSARVAEWCDLLRRIDKARRRAGPASARAG